jgi:5'-3' exonuclease
VPAPLLLVDVPWLLYRSFFALPKSIVGTEGKPVNALLGTVNAILSVYEGRLTAQDPRRVVACMGAEEAAYRVALYPAYHAHREPMPDELRWQWERAPALLESLGWLAASSAELEADDVMFSFARVEEESGGSALIVSGDRDMFAAVSERVSVVELGKGGKLGLIGPEQVRERYGVEPEQVADFIALRGDPSDGLPGAPGIGAKTAAELLNAHDTLEALLEAAGAAADDRRTNAGESAPVAAASELADASTSAPALTIRPRVAATLRDNEQLLRTFARVATLQRIDVDAPPDRSTDYAGGAQAASDLGMTRLAARLRGMA